MPNKQFEHLQEQSLQRLKEKVPTHCPLVVRRVEGGGFVAATVDGRDELQGRFQVVAAFIDGFVCSWQRIVRQRSITGEKLRHQRHAYQPDHNGECMVCDELADAPNHS